MELLIKQYRQRAGMTKIELARRAGITRQYLAQIELNKSMPTIAVLYRITRILNCTLEDIVREKADQE